ncbi:MAG: HAD-IC family P-type ATPase, partial [Candidatus Pacebacteria bacterium]|nr:HAD-IC family P-type ATPase [Candidatus Paceibacterota bacterium]
MPNKPSLNIKNLHIKPYSKSESKLFELMHAEAQGLSKVQVSSRQAQFGPNKIRHKKQFTVWKIIFDQFHSILVLILIFAAGFSLLVGELVDSLAIFAIIVLNALLGFIQEFKAEKSLEDLRQIETQLARVVRDGEVQEIKSEEIVPGDILLLDEGSQVAADARLLEVHSLKVDESMLTGESVSSVKDLQVLDPQTALADRTNMVFAGTVVTQGKGRALVIRTGMKTEMGKIAQELSTTPQEETPLQKALDKLGKYLALISIGIAVPGLLLGLLTGRSLNQMIMLTISLAVSTIPEGLPIVVTISLALGIKRMVKKQVLVRKLATAESLGGVEVICTDKTGTITQNKMTVNKLYLPDKGLVDVKTNRDRSVNKSDQIVNLAQMAVLCSDATLTVGDPTERALLVFAQHFGVDFKKLRQQCVRVNEVPFSSDKKYMMAQVEGYTFDLGDGWRRGSIDESGKEQAKGEGEGQEREQLLRVSQNSKWGGVKGKK